MSITEKALWIIERNHQQGLSLGAIAEACGVSKYQLAHAFGQSTGISVMDYVRARRLSLAATKLASGADNILSLALESGYESHEAFSRAFKSRFGVTPEAVRKKASVAALALVAPLNLGSRRTAQVGPPTFEALPRLLAVGLPATYAFSAVEGIAGQWQRFMTEFHPQIASRRPAIPIGIAQAVDEDGNFSYVAAAEVTAFEDVPRGLVSIEIPARRWAVFRHDGHVTQLAATYAAVWDGWQAVFGTVAADTPAIERHRPTFDPRTGLGGIDIWIPVEP